MEPVMSDFLQRFGKRSRSTWMLLVGCLVFQVAAATADDFLLKSPDGKLAIDCSIDAEGALGYKIDYAGKPVLLNSHLGFEPDLVKGFQFVQSDSRSHSGQWAQVYGERKEVPDNYHELNVDLKHNSGRLLRFTFRAYNEGAALRYQYLLQNGHDFELTAEKTEFHLPSNTWGYEEHASEGEYQRARVNDIKQQCERPLTLEFETGLFACVAEADNERYPRMLLEPLPGASDALVTELGGTTLNTVPRTGLVDDGRNAKATLHPGESTPWRVVLVGEKPGDLLEHNYLLLNLNPPLALSDTAWIKPGKCMRDTTLTTANSKAIIDFAATAGLSYVAWDWHWHGNDESQATGDATKVRDHDLDLDEVLRYGKEKNVGLIVYVDRRQIKSQRDVLFPLYEKIGIKGVKIGFVEVGPQAQTAWITETIQKAAEHHLLLDIHDGYRPTGYSRTYPNLMTVEGIRGNEHFPTAAHNCTLPFTRYIAGPGDYTVCYYDRRLKTSHAHQLAMAVVSYSPLQWIFWYDKPSMYSGEADVEFFQNVATVWDDTKVVQGEIGKYATIARRSGDDWFIGTVNGDEARDLQLSLTFLDAAKKYTAHVYADDETISSKTKVSVNTRPVDSQTQLRVPLKPSGGQAIWIECLPAHNQ
jgi:alpha-glucosidase